jgi:RNA polymerase sigma factor (sigma-70 family)
MKVSSHIVRNPQMVALRQRRYGALYRRFGRRLQARCRAILGNSEDAEDAMHDVLIRALDREEEIPDKDEEALPLLFRMATNLSLNRVRDLARRREHVASLPRRDADQFVDTVEKRDQVRKVLAEVSTDHRVPIISHCVEGLDQQEVGDLLGRSRKTINTKVGDGLKKMRAVLTGWDD